MSEERYVIEPREKENGGTVIFVRNKENPLDTHALDVEEIHREKREYDRRRREQNEELN